MKCTVSGTNWRGCLTGGTVSVLLAAVLLTGDISQEVEWELVRSGARLNSPVLKVAHHGSTGGISAEQLAIVRPEVAVISVGVGNKFGHPAAETLALLREHDCRIVRTDECGDISFAVSPRDGSYKVAASRALRVGACETIPAVLKVAAVMAPGHLLWLQVRSSWRAARSLFALRRTCACS